MYGACSAGAVLISVVEYGTVVACEYHDSVVVQTFLLQIFHSLAHAPVGFYHHIAACSRGRLALELRCWDAWNVRLVQSVVEEERLALRHSVDVSLHFGEYVGSHGLLVPDGTLAAFHESYAWNAVNHSVLMSVTPVHLHQFGVVHAGGFALERVFIIYGNGVVGVEVGHASVLDIHRRHTIDGGGDEVGVVEPDGVARRCYLSVPVNLALAHAQMPLAYGGGGVAGVLEHLANGELVGADEQRSIAWQNLGIVVTPRIHARHEAVARRCGCGRRGVSVGEAGTVLRQEVDVGCRDGAVAVGTHIAPAQVVGYDYYHVGSFCRPCRHRHRRQ